jgi:predicted lipid-binding transport protein (Tim44 family)
VPNYPTYPNVPPEYPPPQLQPNASGLLSQLLGGLLGGQGTGNLLLIAILGWQIYRAFAKSKGIPLVVDDATAAQLVQLLQTLRPTQRPASHA